MPFSLTSHTGRKKLKITSLIFIIISLFLPSFWGSEIRGIQVMTLGWISWLSGDWLPALAWLGIPLSFISLIPSPSKKGLRMSLAFLAFFFALLSLLITQIPTDDSGGFVAVIPGIGVAVWLMGVFGLFIYHLDRFRNKIRRTSHRKGKHRRK